ncbi:hypothetical protein B484DRAFT_396603, partial [Ochromonadaceae sp. CCMP2298]
MFSLREVCIGVGGMTSGHDAGEIEEGLRHKRGVLSASVDLSSSSVVVAFDPSSVTAAYLVQGVRALGYEAEVLRPGGA